MLSKQLQKYSDILESRYKEILSELTVGNKSEKAKSDLLGSIKLTLTNMSNKLIDASKKKLLGAYLKKMINVCHNHPKLKRDTTFQEKLNELLTAHNRQDLQKQNPDCTNTKSVIQKASSFFDKEVSPKAAEPAASSAEYVPECWEELAEEQPAP